MNSYFFTGQMQCGENYNLVCLLRHLTCELEKAGNRLQTGSAVFWGVGVDLFWCWGFSVVFFVCLDFFYLLFSEIDLILACTYAILFIGPGIITVSENKIKSYLVAPKYQFACPGP